MGSFRTFLTILLTVYATTWYLCTFLEGGLNYKEIRRRGLWIPHILRVCRCPKKEWTELLKKNLTEKLKDRKKMQILKQHP